MITVTCQECQKTFTKPDTYHARMALKTHARKSHGTFIPLKEVQSPPPPAPPPELALAAQPEAPYEFLAKRTYKPRAPRSPQVTWTSDELETLAAEAAKRRVANPTADFKAILTEAQDALPADRRRKSCQFVSQYPEGTVERVQLKLDAMKHRAELPPVEIIHTVSVEVPVEKPLTDALAKLTTAQLVGEAFARLVTSLDNVSQALKHSGVNGHSNSHAQINGGSSAKAAPPLKAPARAPRIAVVGLLADQFRHVQDKMVGKDVDLLFIDKDRSSPSIPAVDAVIVERHCNHKWSDAASSRVGQARVLHADGISTVVQRCYDLLSRNLTGAT